jgi:hypothetical protein
MQSGRLLVQAITLRTIAFECLAHTPRIAYSMHGRAAQRREIDRELIRCRHGHIESHPAIRGR